MPDRQLLPREAANDPFIDTHVIDMQDLEHQANRRTRVNNAGVEVKDERAEKEPANPQPE